MTGRLFALLMIGCLLAAAVVFSEWHSTGEPVVAAARPAIPEPAPPPALAVEPPRIDDLVSITLAQPLFSPTRQPTAAEEASETAPDFRLTGIVMEANRRLAIFATANAKPQAVEEGGQVYGWQVDSISPSEVSMSGPAGTRKMQPRKDPALKGAAPRPTAAVNAPAPLPPQPRRQNAAAAPAAASTAPARSPLAGGPPSPITFPLTSSSFPPTGVSRPRQ